METTHSGRQELALLAGLYAAYQAVRGIRGHDLDPALRHAHDVVQIERALHVFEEQAVQRLCGRIPALLDVLAYLYPVLHVTVTVGALVWLYRAHRSRFAFVRTALVATSAVALIVYVSFPVAPPRLAVPGFMDTVSHDSPFDLGSRLVGYLYNPVAAVPSIHIAYALLLGASVARLSQTAALRAAATVYPFVTLLVIVATGNHFFFDAATGALAALVGWFVARRACGEVGAGSSVHDQDVARRVAGHTLAHAAVQETIEEPPLVRPDDDQVGSPPRRERDDRLAGITGLEVELDGHRAVGEQVAGVQQVVSMRLRRVCRIERP